MTNRDRAQKIIDECFPASASTRLANIGLDLIENSLDEAEKRGFIDGTNTGWKNGRLQGREEMRGMAAKISSDLFVGCAEKYLYKSSVHEAIRALPVEE